MTKQKSTKRALLMSGIALLMCVSMLIGSTYAWFTDTASTAVNKIQSGTLDVALEMLVGDEWVDAEGETLSFQAADGRTEILWEPGCTYELPVLRIVNKGNLALKYKVIITGIDGDAKLNEAIDWYYSVDLSSLIPGTTGWTTPTDQYKLENFGEEDYLLPEGHAANARTHESVFKIIGKMRTDAGNEYQNLTIENIGITVVATQYTYEKDSYNDQYDEDATFPSVWDGSFEAPTLSDDGFYHITNASEFAYIVSRQLNAGTKYSIDADIDLSGRTITTDNQRPLDNVIIEGNGHTISNFVMDNTHNPANYYGGLFGYFHNAGSIKDLTVKNATIKGGKQVGGIIGGMNGTGSTVENCHAINCTIIGEKKVGAVVGYTASGYVKDCSAKNCSVYSKNSEAGEVVGFINTTDAGCVDNTSSNTYENVQLYIGEAISSGVMETTDGTYQIYNAAGLQWFADQVNVSQKTFSGKTVELAADIDLGGAEWTPVGNDGGKIFTGTFDGKGHTIKNFKITDKRTMADDNTNANVKGVGFFGWLNGYVKDVTFEKATVTGYHNVGVLAGYQQFGQITNVTVKDSTVTATHIGNNLCGDKVGGIVGVSYNVNYNSATNTYVDMINCKVIDTTVNGGRDTGMIAGAAVELTDKFAGCTATDVTLGTTEGCTGTNMGACLSGLVGRDI